jgi:hypothetical protein
MNDSQRHAGHVLVGGGHRTLTGTNRIVGRENRLANRLRICDQLVETGSGWFYVPTGNLFEREQVQPSQDHHCHVCLGRGREHRSICAFIVPNV